jgi:K+-transporting ATPase KdpF subunit
LVFNFYDELTAIAGQASLNFGKAPTTNASESQVVTPKPPANCQINFVRIMEKLMDPMHLLTAIIAAGLFAYLLFAMLCPEKFS